MSFDLAGQWGPEPVLSATGVALPAATFEVFEDDGVTPAVLYTDESKGSVQAQPANVDGLGNATFWADPGRYVIKFTIGGSSTSFDVPAWVDPTNVISRAAAPLDLHRYAPDGWNPAADFADQTIANALEAVATASSSPSPIAGLPWTIRWGGKRINFRPYTTYRLETQPTFLTEHLVTLGCEVPFGARLKWEGVGNYMFSRGPGVHPTTFGLENLVLEGGGVKLQTLAGMTTLRNLYFLYTPEYAISTEGANGVIYADIDRVFMFGCAGGINAAADTHAVMLIRRCLVNGVLSLPALRVATAGVRVDDFNFQGRHPDFAGVPMVHVDPSLHPVRDVRLMKARFGPEIITASDPDMPPARSSIVVGPLGSTSSALVQDLHILDCEFDGASPSGPDSGLHAVELNCDTDGMVVDRCRFKPYGGPLILENYLAAGGRAANARWGASNTIYNTHQYPIFDKGGVGWRGNPLHEAVMLR